MTDNCELLSTFIEQKTIEINYGPIFDEPVAPMPEDFDFGRIEGMMLGLAIGDALGNTTESQLPQKRYGNHGEIRNYLPNRHANGQCVGLPTDDTQLAFWTLEQLIEDGGFIPENVAKKFSQNRIYGIGGTVRKFLSNIKSGKPWHESGPSGAGNGALMRIAPMLIPHLSKGGTSLWCDAALSAMITHNDSGSIAACVAFIGMLWDLLTAKQPPEPEWWLDRYISIAKGIETGKTYRPRGGNLHTEYQGPMWGYVERTIRYAMEKNLSVQEAKEIWYSAAYLLETMTFALLILIRHGHDPEEAIVRAVNDTKDNDTTAAIVGAAIGALHGRDNLPERWLKGLLGRTGKDDDGKVFELLTHARHCFWIPKEAAIYFYSSKDEYSEFSNFSKHGIEMDGLWWPTVEHYFQAQKFQNPEYQDRIRKSPTPKEAKWLGQSRKVPIREDWNEIKDDIMRQAVKEKFNTHVDLRNKLFGTGDRPLVENSPSDTYWGCGKDGKGKNMLGKILEQVRQQLKADFI